jgi:hypothetical protein
VISVAASDGTPQLVGTWNYNSLTALKNGKPFGTVHFQPGQWTATFSPDGTWTMKTPPSINPNGLNGSYQLHGHEVEMKLADGKPYQKYRFAIEDAGKVLVLTAKDSVIRASLE